MRREVIKKGYSFKLSHTLSRERVRVGGLKKLQENCQI
jgi:hypothetical protein